MATRSITTFQDLPSTATPITADELNDLPKGRVGYLQKTTNFTPFTTETDITGLTGLTRTLEASRTFDVECLGRVESSASTDEAVTLRIYQDATQIAAGTIELVTAGEPQTIRAACQIQPTSGSKTFKATIERVTGSGTMTFDASSIAPAHLTITDVGPAF